MSIAKRYTNNPILLPLKHHAWEAEEVFNGCPVKDGGKIHLFYRAMSNRRNVSGAELSLSSIGHTVGVFGKSFHDRRQFIKPGDDWDKYGCEDPRVTKMNGKYFIFYTALSRFPFTADGIKVGLGITSDFKTVEKHQVTTFNSKAMALFPEKINGKYVAILTADTDRPPSKIALAFFNEEKEIWSKRYWNEWYKNVDKYKINFNQPDSDHIEMGAAPLRIKEGWLLIYSHIRNYFRGNPTFEIRAVLLDAKNPTKIIGRTESALLVPEEPYEIYGKVPKIVFPSGAYIDGENLHVYYGAADTVCCGARFLLRDVVKDLLTTPENRFSLERCEKNPIIKPNLEHSWEAKATFNAGAIYEGGKFHLLYRAMSNDNTSVIGYASSRDGFNIDERLDEPVYVPREDFERKGVPDGNSGCEDPRLIKFGNRIYMLYTAFNGLMPPAVAITSISREDFLARRWNWEKPKLISPAGKDNKDAVLFPEKIKGKYYAIHRLNNGIDISSFADLKFEKEKLSEETGWIEPRPGKWDNRRVGINGVPIKTKYGWLALYHGIADETGTYRFGALLLDLENPEEILARTENYFFEPLKNYEKVGQVPKAVFSCGSVLRDDTIFIYYGGADTTLNVATVSLKKLLTELLSNCYGCDW
jgi:beta-1,2-mannobiose phosphorylase / 1,2-beta-oligomannan phosphorylase